MCELNVIPHLDAASLCLFSSHPSACMCTAVSLQVLRAYSIARTQLYIPTFHIMVKRKDHPTPEQSRANTVERHKVLMSLGMESHASGRAISLLMHDIEELEDGVPTAHARGTLYNARNTVCNELTPYGPLVVTKDVKGIKTAEHKIAIQNPLAMLWKAVQISSWFTTLLQDALRNTASSCSSPWSIILYQDGVNPSDGLSKNMSRKSGAFYWSFLEFGMEALSKEESWMALC